MPIIQATTKEEMEARTAVGLVKGHAYSILHVGNYKTREKEYRLVCLKNPWSDDTEWKGDFSDYSDRWDREQSNDHDRADGKLYMKIEDFVKYFTKIEI